MATPIYMPARGESTAPIFDPAKSRELPRFFDDLEYLFDSAQVTRDLDKKRHLLRYVDFNTEQMWKSIPEYSNNTKTYEDFKSAILYYYPDASGDFVHSLSDIDILIAERLQLGITSPTDLSDYHLQFFTITTWLIKKRQLAELEQQRAYIRAFPAALLSATFNRLQIKNPDHHPNIPYQIKEVYDAALFILRGPSPSIHSPVAPPVATTSPSSVFTSPPIATISPSITTTVSAPETKHETITSLFSELTKTISNALQDTGRSGSSSHHFCNQNQPAAATLFNTVKKDNLYGQNLQTDHIPSQIAKSTSQQSHHDRIASLEAEILALRTRKSPVAPKVHSRVARAPESTDTRVRFSDHKQVAPIVVTRDTTQVQHRFPDTINISTSQPQSKSEQCFYHTGVNIEQLSTQQDIALLSETLEPSRFSYSTSKPINPIFDLKSAVKVLHQSIGKPATVAQQELRSLAPEIPRPHCTTSYSFNSTQSPIFPPGLAISTNSKVITPQSSISTLPAPITSSTPSEILPPLRNTLDSSSPTPSSIYPTHRAVQTVPKIFAPPSSSSPSTITPPEILSSPRATLDSFSSIQSSISPSHRDIHTVQNTITPPSSISASTAHINLLTRPENLPSPRATSELFGPVQSSISPLRRADSTVPKIVKQQSLISSPATSSLVPSITNSRTAQEIITPHIHHLSSPISINSTSPNIPSLHQPPMRYKDTKKHPNRQSRTYTNDKSRATTFFTLYFVFHFSLLRAFTLLLFLRTYIWFFMQNCATSRSKSPLF